jgi:DNA-binding transcriptional ArsR family regulator
MDAALAEIPDTARLDEVFHALSDPTRRAILARLVERPATVTDLARPFPISLPAVSKHLKVLEHARLISRDVEGRRHRCSLVPGTLREAEAWLGPYRAFWESHFEAVDELLSDRRKSTRRSPSKWAARPRRRAP